MQNKGAIWVFTILLVLACLYQISFTFVTNSVENEAADAAKLALQTALTENADLSQTAQDTIEQNAYDSYLKGKEAEEVYPVFNYTYMECKEREINLGLDLRGGMNVTLEISIAELLDKLANKTDNPAFRNALNAAVEAQNTSGGEFVDLYVEAWKAQNPEPNTMVVPFLTRENKEKFSRQMTDEEVIQKLRDEAESAIVNCETVLRSRIDQFGVTQPTIQRQEASGRIMIELPGVKDKDRVRKLLQSTARLEFWDVHTAREFVNYMFVADSVLARTLHPEDFANDSTATDSANAIAATPEPIANDDDTTKVDADDISNILNGGDANSSNDEDTVTSSVLQEGGEETADARKNPLMEIFLPAIRQNQNGQWTIDEGARLGSALATDTSKIRKWLQMDAVKRVFPRNVKFAWDAKPFNGYVSLYALNINTRDKEPKIDGNGIIDASQQFQQFTQQPEVSLTMNDKAASTWENWTSEVGQRKGCIAIVLDNLVQSAPSVDQKISGGRSSISGGMDVSEATLLANILNAGALPVPANIVQEAVVGATLGGDNIKASLISFIIAFMVVLLYMMFYYAKGGLVSNVALIANIFFIVGTLASLGAALTLPGVAGLVLTIGMSVDANVLIYERIREEIAAGKGPKLAIADGYKRAYAAIVDANVTTMLTAIILAYFGTGPVQGFATTLIIGILTSLFSAIFITRLIFTYMLERKKNITFSTPITAGAFKKINIPWIKKRKVFYLLSALIIAGGIASLLTNGLDPSVEFTGGRFYIVQAEGAGDKVAELKTAIAGQLLDADGKPMTPEVKTFGSDNQVKITTKYRYNEKGVDVDQAVEDQVMAGFATVFPDVAEADLIQSESVGGSISADIRNDSIMAILIALFVIFLYIVMRFRRWQFGLGALIAMFHDVLVVLGLFSIFYKIMPFSMEIDQAFIAAVLTVVGYSINDTVVVFDRIREYLGLHKKKDGKEVVNMALNSTLSRTINTSLSTFIVLLMIFIFGGESIKGFAFALMIGVVVGTYSSLCIATPTVVDFAKNLTKGDAQANK